MTQMGRDAQPILSGALKAQAGADDIASMRYQESASHSSELLRQILPRVAKHGGHLVPTTYAVWFEYLAGLNPRLVAAVDLRLQANPNWEQPEIEQLYEKFIDARELGSLERFQAGLAELLRRLGDMVAASSEGTDEYAHALAECQQQLSIISDSEGLNRIIQSLVKSTTAVRASTEALQKEVTATRNEVQQLRGQMGALQNLAQSDSLTRLRNRRGFELAVAEYAQSHGESLHGCAVLVADIDQFKKVNDTYGHLVGDQVIRAAAQVLQNGVKGRDITGRWGGEEFVVLLPATPAEGAVAVADQLRLAFSKARIRKGGKAEVDGAVTLSVGVAVAAVGDTLEDLIGRADAALYEAKTAGRNCVRLAVAVPAAAPAADD